MADKPILFNGPLVKVLTVYQPWASLIIMGAKPYEFRRWDYSKRFPSYVGSQIAIHASARMPREDEVADILQRIQDDVSQLNPEIAAPALERMLNRLERIRELGRRPSQRRICDRVQWERDREHIGPVATLSAVLGTAVIGKPVMASELFDQPANDSYRMDHSMWAWPLTDIQAFDEPVPARGAQGFWNWSRGDNQS